jgi:hypothetical protein
VETRGVYTLVEATHARRRRVEAIARYDSESFMDARARLKAGSEFGTPEDQAARIAVVNLLQGYLDALAEVSGDKAMTGAEASSADAGKSLTTLAKKDLPALMSGPPKAAGTTTTTTISPGGTISTTTTTAGSAAGAASSAGSAGSSASGGDAALAIDAIGHVIAERKRAKALPGILESAEGPVQTLCELLRSDIGAPEPGVLRVVLQTDYEALESAEDAAIRDHPKDYSYPERRAAIDALYSLMGEQEASDATLVEADRALAEFEKAHTELAKTARQKRAPGLRALLAELTAEAEQLGDLEKAMSKSASGGK